jgi:hypothetical protein
MSSNVDLASIFQGVVGALQENKEDLNQADEYNHNHGDNMVDIFNLITNAVAEKQDAGAAGQLAHASELVKEIDSGSAQVYARGLSQAAEQFKDRALTQENAVDLLSALLNAGEAPLQQEQSGSGMLGSLLSGLAGGEEDEQDKGLDAGDLLGAGLRFFQSKQRGESNMEALMDAIVHSSSVGQVPHRAQSGKVVAETLISLLGAP